MMAKGRAKRKRKVTQINILDWAIRLAILHENIEDIYLGGSRVRGTHSRLYSDYDVMIRLSEESYEGMWDQIDMIEQRIAFDGWFRGLDLFFRRPDGPDGPITRWASKPHDPAICYTPPQFIWNLQPSDLAVRRLWPRGGRE